MDKQPKIGGEEPTEVCESSSLSTQERSNNNNTWRRDLYDAVVKGDWNKTESLINSHPEALSGRLFREETILHTAVLHDHLHHVQQLVKKMSKEDTEIRLPGEYHSTALHLASTRKSVKIAQVLVETNPDLLCIRDVNGNLPVTGASTLGNKAMVRYLFSVTPKEELKPSKSRNGVGVLNQAIANEDYESLNHVLCNGSIAADVWKTAAITLGINYVDGLSWWSTVMQWFNVAKKSSHRGILLGIIPSIITWRLWMRRCKARMENSVDSASNVWLAVKVWLRKISSLMVKHWPISARDETILRALEVPYVDRARVIPKLVYWRKPAEGWIKLNVDCNAPT